MLVYHMLLAIVALSYPEKGWRDETNPRHTFAIVIPAHNEEINLPNALVSCRELDYPRDKYTVYVIADNCDDCTAEIAVEHGAVCLVRKDTLNRGNEWQRKDILICHKLAESPGASHVEARSRIVTRLIIEEQLVTGIIVLPLLEERGIPSYVCRAIGYSEVAPLRAEATGSAPRTSPTILCYPTSLPTGMDQFIVPAHDQDRMVYAMRIRVVEGI